MSGSVFSLPNKVWAGFHGKCIGRKMSYQETSCKGKPAAATICSVLTLGAGHGLGGLAGLGFALLAVYRGSDQSHLTAYVGFFCPHVGLRCCITSASLARHDSYSESMATHVYTALNEAVSDQKTSCSFLPSI